MSSNMYPYNRPTEGGTLAVSENGIVDLAGTNYSKINVNVSGGGEVTLGELTEILMLDAEPVVDSALSANSHVFSCIMIGDSVVADGEFTIIAGGVKAYGWLYAEDETANITVAVWAITYEDSGHDPVCKSRRALTADCGVVYGDPLSQGESATWVYLIVPDTSTLADGEGFAFSIVNSNN